MTPSFNHIPYCSQIHAAGCQTTQGFSGGITESQIVFCRRPEELLMQQQHFLIMRKPRPSDAGVLDQGHTAT